MTLLNSLLTDATGSISPTSDQTYSGNMVYTGPVQINILNAGSNGNKGTITIYPASVSKGALEIVATENVGDVKVTITQAAHSAARTYTLPDAGKNANIVLSEGQQLINGLKVFTVAPAGIGETVTLPLATITGLGGANKIVFVASYNGTIVGAKIVLEAAITLSNITGQLRIGSTNVTNGSMTIPFASSGFGSNAACSPTANNTFVVGDIVSINITGGVGVGVGGNVTVYVVRTS